MYETSIGKERANWEVVIVLPNVPVPSMIHCDMAIGDVLPTDVIVGVGVCEREGVMMDVPDDGEREGVMMDVSDDGEEEGVMKDVPDDEENEGAVVGGDVCTVVIVDGEKVGGMFGRSEGWYENRGYESALDASLSVGLFLCLL